MIAAFTTTGTLTDGTTLTLDTPAPAGSGRVRVTVEPIPAAGSDPLNLNEFFEQLRKDHEARGHVPLSREEIDAFMREERAGWEGRHTPRSGRRM